MTKKKLALYAFLTGVFILLLNLLAMKGALYYIFWWFDMPMHFIGGFWSGMLALLIFYKYFSKNQPKDSTRSFLYYILIVVVIGILWEVYEYAVEMFIVFDIANVVDSVSDLFFDTAGGLAFLLSMKDRI